MGSATHILTAHHGSSPGVGWIINPISKRYMGLLVRRIGLFFSLTVFDFFSFPPRVISKAVSKSTLHLLRSTSHVWQLHSFYHTNLAMLLL